jgi:hypothetical protein
MRMEKTPLADVLEMVMLVVSEFRRITSANVMVSASASAPLN